MSTIDVRDSVRAAVARQLRVSPEVLTGDQDLTELGLDDDHVAVGVLEAVEAVLEVRFPDDFLDGVRTYGELDSAIRVAVRL